MTFSAKTRLLTKRTPTTNTRTKINIKKICTDLPTYDGGNNQLIMICVNKSYGKVGFKRKVSLW